MYVLICRWITPSMPEPYNDEIAWLDGSSDGPESLFSTMGNFLQEGQRMEILEVMGDLDFNSAPDLDRMKAALKKHRNLHSVEGVSYQMLKERGYLP